jgi:O-antigen biosynthesis protein
MSLRRRAGAPRLIDWTGERCVPWAPDVQVVYEHYHRYLWAASVVAGRRVLDLGSGEGFGAAILAELAAQVVGVDIDERTVEHSRLNYSAENLEFRVGSALDLSDFKAGSFGAVVAFEVIEHVQDQERVLSEIARVLADDGLLIMSTPERHLYAEATGQDNPFHERELTLEQFRELLAVHFAHLAAWGQRTITGSHMHPLDDMPGTQMVKHTDFYLEHSGDDWRLADDPAALYVIAMASNVPLPSATDTSTLADCGLELLRSREREVVEAAGERTKAALEAETAQLLDTLERHRAEQLRDIRQRDADTQKELTQRDRDILVGQERVAELHQEIAVRDAQLAARESELAAAKQLNRRTEESITWQTFQRIRGRLYGAVGEQSLLARALRLSLKVAGWLLTKRSKASPVAPGGDRLATDQADGRTISLPEYDNPTVSLIIPLYAHAELTRACLTSIREHTSHVSYEVILVDDEADDETKRLLEAVQGAKIVHNEQNIGYLRSVNRGASMARGRWLVLFNNDTEVTRGWLRAMLACAESAEDIGVVTPKFIYPDGSLNEAGGIIWRDGTGVNYGRGEQPNHFQYEYRREVDYGSAAALMVNAELWRQVGGYDERYLPMFYEDADLCFEARERGLRVVYEPEAVVVHVEGATTGNDVESGHKRHQEQNRPKFVAKWRQRLESEHLRPDPTNVWVAANRHNGPHVLVVDHRIPMWDRDAGSLRMLNIMQALIRLGARVTFMPDSFSPVEPYTRGLQRMGIEVLYGQLHLNAVMATIGPGLDLAILSRPHAASRWLDTIRGAAPAATVAYDTVDLHWLREARRTTMGNPTRVATVGNGAIGELAPKAQALRHLELAMIRAADAVIVVSDCERAQVEEDAPGTKVLVIPTVHDVEPFVPPPEDRSGVLFVGGFEHPPNIDAAVRLVKEVMPDVWRELGEVRVTIVGPEPPPEVKQLASALVDVTGWVEDLRPLLDQSRLMLAPLRYGAGVKGKITQALAAGLPVVTTPIGVEGLEGADDEFILVREESAGLAAQTVRLYRDNELWRDLSRAGQALIAQQFSTEMVYERLGELLSRRPGSTSKQRDVLSL